MLRSTVRGMLGVGARRTIDEVLVFQLHGLGTRIQQPWVATAQRDQRLMQPVCRLSQRGQFGRGEPGNFGRTSSSPPKRLLLLDAHIALFVAVMRCFGTPPTVMSTANCQRRLGRANLRCDTRHVMVADERLRHEGDSGTRCAASSSIQLEEFSVSSACWIDFHSSYCVIRSIVDSSMMRWVIAMDHLAENPRITGVRL